MRPKAAQKEQTGQVKPLQVNHDSQPMQLNQIQNFDKCADYLNNIHGQSNRKISKFLIVSEEENVYRRAELVYKHLQQISVCQPLEGFHMKSIDVVISTHQSHENLHLWAASDIRSHYETMQCKRRKKHHFYSPIVQIFWDILKFQISSPP